MKKEKEKRRDHISMTGIKNYFKPDSEIVAKETNVETNIIAKETNAEQSQCSIVKGMSLVAEKPCQLSSSFTFLKTAFGKRNRSCQCTWFTELNWFDYNEVSDSVRTGKKNLTSIFSMLASMWFDFLYNNFHKLFPFCLILILEVKREK